MIAFQVADRYAKALFNLGGSKDVVEQRIRLLETLADSLKKTPHFFLNPQIDSQRETVLKKNISDTEFLAFLKVLKQHGKFPFLRQIAAKYRQFSERSQTMIFATVITAMPLDPSLKQHLQQKLSWLYQMPVSLTEKSEHTLIGGSILIIGNRMADFSIKGRLERMKHSILRNL